MKVSEDELIDEELADAANYVGKACQYAKHYLKHTNMKIKEWTKIRDKTDSMKRRAKAEEEIEKYEEQKAKLETAIVTLECEKK